MSARRKKSEAAIVALDDIDGLFPLTNSLRPTEVKQFCVMREAIAASVAPENFLEKIYVNELAHLAWQIQSHRDAIASLVANAWEEGLVRLLAGRHDDLPTLVRAVRRRDPDAIRSVRGLMSEFGLTDKDAEAHARAAIGEDILKLESDCLDKRTQFDHLVQSFERRRIVIAERLRRFTDVQPIAAEPHLKLSGGNSA